MGTETLGRGVLEITTDGAKFRKGLGDVKKDADGLGPSFTKLGGLLAGAFTISAVTGFAKELANFASEMLDISAQTGISTTRLQAWDLVLAKSGLSVGDLASSVLQLSKRLIEGDKSAVRAVEYLGLNVQELIALGPDQALIKLAEAAAKIPDPMEKSTIGVELLGRSGAKFFRLANDELSALLETAEKGPGIITDETLKRIDDFDEKIGEAWKTARGFIATVGLGAIDGLGQLGTSLMGVTLGMKDLGTSTEKTTDSQMKLVASHKQVDDSIQPVKQSYADFIKAQEASEEASKKAAKELQKQVEEFAKQTERMIAADREALAMYQKSVDEAKKERIQKTDEAAVAMLNIELERWQREQALLLEEREGKMRMADEYARERLALEVSASEDRLRQVDLAAQMYLEKELQLHQASTASWSEYFTALSTSFTQLATISGDSMNAVTRSIGTAISAMATATTAIGALKGGFDLATKGDGLKSILGGLGSIIGGIGGIVGAAQAAVSAIKAMWDGLRRLFGGGEEGVEVNPRRDQFFEQYGGYEGLAALLTEATDGNIAEELIRRLFDAETLDDFRAAEDAIIAIVGGKKFAKGGIVLKPTIGLVGEAGPEAVLPLKMLKEGFGARDDQIIAAISQQIAAVNGLRRDLMHVLPNMMETASRHGAQMAWRRT